MCEEFVPILHTLENSFQLYKQLRRRLGFVLQDDALFLNFTLWETLYFTTMIWLPEMETYGNQVTRLNEVIDDILALRRCLNTNIWDMMNGGLSGGEKERVSVACELLMDRYTSIGRDDYWRGC